MGLFGRKKRQDDGFINVCVWQVGIQPARQRKSNHFGSEIQPPYCSAIALSNVANGNSAHHA